MKNLRICTCRRGHGSDRPPRPRTVFWRCAPANLRLGCAQSLVGIGSARFIFTLAYIATSNLWVSAGAHIIKDWAGFIFVLELGRVPTTQEA
ncbi:hypothetical protein AGR1B_pa0059 [Agrobacterium fabacearum S56]|nr:hypothetical protein AGR1B_pa0059 [Agrobacterium fabacearum S56]